VYACMWDKLVNFASSYTKNINCGEYFHILGFLRRAPRSMANTETTFAILSLSCGIRMVYRTWNFGGDFGYTKNAISNFLEFFSHFCMHFDFSLIFQALRTP